MSELQYSSSVEQDSSQIGQVDQQSAGVLLKQARQAAGLHIAALAVLLKVPVKKLEALEADRLDLLPDAVFIRALAASVCRTLKIDAAPILAKLPQTDTPKLIYKGVGINAPFRTPGDGPRPSVWAQVSRPAVLAGLVLLLGALVLVFLPVIKTSVNGVNSDAISSRIAGVATAANTAPAKSAPVQQIGNEAMISASASTSTDVAAFAQAASGTISSGTAGAPTSILNSSVTMSESGSVPVSASKALTGGASSATFAVTSKAQPDGDLIVFIAKGQTWVEATDAKGQVVLRRVLNAGEVAGAAGVLPLRVVVGRASETQVQIRGKAFDLNAFAKDNVARFEVK